MSSTPSGFETIERLKPDLAVIDLSLPVSSGSNIVRQIKWEGRATHQNFYSRALL
jgi:CheY-like chemotaxis protein